MSPLDRDIDQDVKEATQHIEMHVLGDKPVGSEVVGQEQPLRGKMRTVMALIALAVTFGSQLGVGSNMTPSVLTDIAGAFGATAQAGWISSGWLLATCVSFTVSGRLADIFGRRAIITGSNLLALIGFSICAFTSSFQVLVGGIIVLGVAGGLAQTATAAACEIVPNKYRPLVIALLELSIAPSGSLTGSTFGHLFVAYSSYKWVFRLGMILCGVAFVLCILFYQPPTPQQAIEVSKIDLMRQIDYIGIILFAGGLGSVLMGVIWAAGVYPASDPHVIAPIVVGIVCLAGFAFWCSQRGDSALMPPRLFRGKTRTFLMPTLTHFVSGTVFFGQVALWPLQSAMFYANDSVEVGILGLPSGVAVVLGGCILGPLIPKLGRTDRQLFISLTIMVAATACGAALTPDSKTAGIAVQMLSTFLFPYIVNLCFVSVQFSQDEHDIGIATGICGSARSLGGCVAVSVYLTILGSQVASKVPPAIIASTDGSGLPLATIQGLVGDLLSNDIDAAMALPDITPEILTTALRAMQWAFQGVFKTIYLTTLGFGIPGLAAAYFTADVSQYFTAHTAVRLGSGETTTSTEHGDGQVA